MPGDKYMSTVKVGAKGQIVIPKEVRDMFGVNPGDSLMLLADPERGIAINRFDYFSKIADEIFLKNKTEDESDHAHLEIFANNIKRAEKGEVVLHDSDKND